MSQNSTPPQLPVGRLVMAGTGLAVAAILLFMAVWFGLGSANVPNALRLVVAICIPPALLMIASIGLYFMRKQD